MKEFGHSGSIDFALCWDLEKPFHEIKEYLYSQALKKNDYGPEYPYEEIFNGVISEGMIRSACRLDKKIQVHYGWEMIDESNVLLNSSMGYVEIPELMIDANKKGFLLDALEEGYLSLSYKSIFWVGEA